MSTASGDLFQDPLPQADMITMGMILHDWKLDKKMHLIRAAYNALPAGGALVPIEALIDDARRENVFGFRKWCEEAGFRRSEVIHLTGASRAAIAYK